MDTPVIHYFSRAELQVLAEYTYGQARDAYSHIDFVTRMQGKEAGSAITELTIALQKDAANLYRSTQDA